MVLRSNTFYSIPNSSMMILILSVLQQDEDSAKLHVAYVSKQNGNAFGMERIEVKKENIKHWEETNNIPFTF